LARVDDAVILYRGNLEPLVVPLTWFRTRPDGSALDISDLAVMDFGQTVRLGHYEAATDAILYEFDDEYRRRARRRQLETDRSLGGALRRLRLQKGLRQSDFPNLTAKETARIERGEVKKLHQRTLAAIAKRIGVSADEILRTDESSPRHAWGRPTTVLGIDQVPRREALGETFRLGANVMCSRGRALRIESFDSPHRLTFHCFNQRPARHSISQPRGAFEQMWGC
jgi:transcriptional regulator with XRE-family HTH domain